MIPTPNECCALLQAYKVPEHIIRQTRIPYFPSAYYFPEGGASLSGKFIKP